MTYTMEVLSSLPWVERLGWTLIHFVWQGAVIAALYAAAQGLARSAKPQRRYFLACVALAAMLAAPAATWLLLGPATQSPGAEYRIASDPPAATPVASGAGSTAALPAFDAAVSAAQPVLFLSWIVMVWLAGAAVFWVRLAGGWMVAARARSSMVHPAPPEWRAQLAEFAGRMGVSRPVRLLVSALAPVPTVIGWLRPVILMPVGALSGLPAEHVEALLLHELAHIRRHDYLVNILQGIAEALLFYHPAVWWVSRHLRDERELCCDDLAVSATGDALTYAHALVQLESYRAPRIGHALAATGGSLSTRIARLLGRPRPASRNSFGAGVLVLAIVFAAAAYGLVRADKIAAELHACTARHVPARSHRRSQNVRHAKLAGRKTLAGGLGTLS